MFRKTVELIFDHNMRCNKLCLIVKLQRSWPRKIPNADMNRGRTSIFLKFQELNAANIDIISMT